MGSDAFDVFEGLDFASPEQKINIDIVLKKLKSIVSVGQMKHVNDIVLTSVTKRQVDLSTLMLQPYALWRKLVMLASWRML